MEALLSDLRPYLFGFELEYPPRNLVGHIVLCTYEHGGILLLDDIGAYVREMRLSGMETLRGFEVVTSISASVLSRLEDGSLERIKLVDVLVLDKALNLSGKLLDMCWDACEFDEWLNRHLYKWQHSHIRRYRSLASGVGDKVSSSKVHQLVSLYIRVNRWFQLLKGADFQWPKYRSSDE
jgi:hypothetical protein